MRGRARWYPISRARGRGSVGAGTLTIPPGGKSPKAKAKMSRNSIPNIQEGTTKVVMEMTVRLRSRNERAFCAILRPSQMPTTAAATVAEVKRRIVRGRRSIIRSQSSREPVPDLKVTAWPS